jgi:hypothetical protein
MIAPERWRAKSTRHGERRTTDPAAAELFRRRALIEQAVLAVFRDRPINHGAAIETSPHVEDQKEI